MHKLREPTEKQVQLAESLGLRTREKSFRVLSAEIADALEIKSFKTVEENGIESGVEVRYIGARDDMPRRLTVSTVAKTGYLYFKGTSKYCRPWDVRVLPTAR
jgi:hypothetical protein